MGMLVKSISIDTKLYTLLCREGVPQLELLVSVGENMKELAKKGKNPGKNVTFVYVTFVLFFTAL